MRVHARAVTAVAAVAGLALLAHAVRTAGPGAIADGLRRLGFGFGLIMALSGLRFAARTASWLVCVEGEPRLEFWDALRAKLIGDALGNLTPLGFFVSEPAKAMLVRGERTAHILSAMVVENAVCAYSALLMIAAGAIGVLLAFPSADPIARAGMVMLASATVAAGAGLLLTARPGLFAAVLGRLHRYGVMPGALHRGLDRVRAIEELVFGFARRRPERVGPLLALTLAFHAAAIAEVYVTLLFVSAAAAPTWWTAFLLEAVNKIVSVAFTFVPLRLGVDETTTGFVSGALQFGTATGVALALVRKIRMLCWSAVGLVLLARRSVHGTAAGR